MIRFAYAVVTYSGQRLVETLHSIPVGSRVLVVDTLLHGWPLAKAWNVAIEELCVREGHDAVILCNDDIILKPDTGENLVDGLLSRQWVEERPWAEREIMLVSGYNTNATADIGTRWETGPDYSCFATHAKMLQTIGPFDENFNPAYFEDNDSHRRIQLCGFEALSYAPYFHYGSQTIQGGGALGEERGKYIESTAFEKCKAYYLSKWGGMPGEETWTTPFGR